MPFPTPQHHNLRTNTPGGCPDTPIPRPRPVEKQRKMTMRMSSPSCTQILFMMRIICSVSMSCRRSSPHCEPPGGGGERPEQGGASGAGCPTVLGARCPRFRAPAGGRAHLEDDPDIFPQGVDVLEGELQGDGVGVEIGAVLPPGKGSKTPSEPAGSRRVTAPPAPALTRGTIPFTSRLGLSGSRHDPLALKNCFTSSSPSRRMPCRGDTRGLRPRRTP